MVDFTYHHIRARSRDRTSPPLPRRTSFKRQRLTLSRSSSSSSDGADDYPYTGAHRPLHVRRTSTSTVTRHAPSRLERWGIWTSPYQEDFERHDSCAEDTERERERERERPRRRRVSFADQVYRDAGAGADGDGDGDGGMDADEERVFRRLSATLSHTRRSQVTRAPSPPSRHFPSPPPLLPRRRRVESDDERMTPRVWAASSFRRGERCVSEGVEGERARMREWERRCRDRERERGFWDDVDDGGEEYFVGGERVVRWRRVRRCTTEERRPLDGWRRL